MKPQLSLLTSTALSATYPVSLKLIYAAEGAPLSPAVITSLRFALMAGGAAFILSDRSAGASVEQQPPPPPADAGFWLAAAELGFWACAGAQFNAAGLQQVGVVRGTILLATINVFTPALSTFLGATEAQRRVSARVWVACAIALFSTVVALLGDAAGAPPKRSNQLMAGVARRCSARLHPRALTHSRCDSSPPQSRWRCASRAVTGLCLRPPPALPPTRCAGATAVGAVARPGRPGQPPLRAGAALHQLAPAELKPPALALDQVRLGTLVASFPAPKLAAARLQTQALCSLPFLAFAANGGSQAALSSPLWTAAGAAAALEWAGELSLTQAALLCLSAATAVTGTLLQFEGQRTVSAAAAQPIYASGPLLTALWAFALLHEPINANEALGGLGACCAAALATARAAEASESEEGRGAT